MLKRSFKHYLLCYFISIIVLMGFFISQIALAANPNLVVTADDVSLMQKAITQPSLFQRTYLKIKARVDQQMLLPIEVPVPVDAGGGYSHERHKKNYQLMYDAGIVYQLSQQQKYADYVKNMLIEYAQLYPTLPLHPKRKSVNEGKLFWQGLNEAVWLVYTIQAYDFILPSLSEHDRAVIEQGIIRPVALFLSEQSPHTFNKVHNHGTWATAAVGMTGYVLQEQDLVEKALYDLEKSGKGGFLKQLDELFSPKGYYNEGPYYQRYALMPFVTFAKAIEVNEPERKIFDYRNGVLLKAIKTTIDLSYNQLFFPINDAIKDKGINTIELVNGVALAFGITSDRQLLDIAQQQNKILLTGDGLKVAQAIEAEQAEKYKFTSRFFGDGSDGEQGALVILRQHAPDEQAVLFKATAQGLGHGHFDKLTWQLYDKKHEIVSDYGAARFLNVEAKYGGRYLPENQTWAKQTIAHNTLVVDETSHFNANVKRGNQHHPSLRFFASDAQTQVVSASIDSAYNGVTFTRTMALLNIAPLNGLVIDLLKVESDEQHQYDLPMHYNGRLINTSFPLNTQTTSMNALGDKNGYQHLWLKAQAMAEKSLNQITWLNDNGKFYTQSTVGAENLTWLFTELGANDPHFNFRHQSSFIQRIHAKNHTFVNVIEPHGEYNPSQEFTVSAVSKITALSHQVIDGVDIVDISTTNKRFILAISSMINSKASHKTQTENIHHTLSYQDLALEFTGRFKLYEFDTSKEL